MDHSTYLLHFAQDVTDMERRVPTRSELRAMLDARLAEAEQAMRDAGAAGVVPDDLRARHDAVLEALVALRRELEAVLE